MTFSYLGNPGVGSLHCVRRAVEKGIPQAIELEEYSHFGMVGRYLAGAYRLPFFPLRSYLGSDLPKVNPRIRFVESPYTSTLRQPFDHRRSDAQDGRVSRAQDGAELSTSGNGLVAVVPPLNPDVTVVHAQRADLEGNTQLWGLLGVQKEAAFAARCVIVVVEEIVDEAVIRADPNRTIIPGLVVDALVHEPYGAHPSYAQGHYDRDNEFYLRWDKISRDEVATQAWLDEWVYGVRDRAEYVAKMGPETWERLQPGEAWAEPVNYGKYV